MSPHTCFCAPKWLGGAAFQLSVCDCLALQLVLVFSLVITVSVAGCKLAQHQLEATPPPLLTVTKRHNCMQVRTATTPEPVAHCILELESFLRAAAFSPTWGSQAQPSPAVALPRKASAGRKAVPKPAKGPVAPSASRSSRLNRTGSSGSGTPYSLLNHAVTTLNSSHVL